MVRGAGPEELGDGDGSFYLIPEHDVNLNLKYFALLL